MPARTWCAFVVLGLVASIGVLSARPARPAVSIALPYKVDPPGTRYQRTQRAEMVFVRTEDGVTTRSTRNKEERKTVEVLASGPDANRKARVTFAAYTSSDGTNAAPMLGHAYLLERIDGKLEIARADGKALGREELAVVRDANERFGKPDQFAQAIAGLELRAGERTVVPADRLVGWEQFPMPVEAALTLLHVKAGRATLDVGLRGDDPAKQRRIDLSGQAIVEVATGRLLSLTVEGTFAMSDGVTGTLKNHQTTTYGSTRGR